MKQGFTLIELLVVVLIISLWAAVALPQAETLATAFYNAEQVYHLANGTYTPNFKDLDIDPPGGGAITKNTTSTDENAGANTWEADHLSCYLRNADVYCIVTGTGTLMAHITLKNGIRSCRCKPENSYECRVCQQKGTYTGTTNAKYLVYKY